MAYGGYNLKINNVTIPNNLIKLGTYQHVPEKRIRSERRDANGVYHYKYYPTPRHRITFTLKAGTKSEYDTIRSAFASRNNVTVRFWNEDTEDYATGTFEMSSPTWTHSFDDTSSFYYADTPIELVQH